MIGSVLLSFLLITKYGVVGASLAWIGAMLIGLLLNYYYVSKQLLKLDIIVTTAKIFLSAIIASGGFLWLRSLEANRLGSLLLGGAIYVFVYSVLLITLRVLSRDELLLLLRQLGQRVATGSQPTLLE
jgi:peptidoglycan biosynthesis protein MviN/MurJ (putative lipid II flippase)